MTKPCPHCNRDLPESEFYTRRDGRLGSWCRECTVGSSRTSDERRSLVALPMFPQADLDRLPALMARAAYLRDVLSEAEWEPLYNRLLDMQLVAQSQRLMTRGLSAAGYDYLALPGSEWLIHLSGAA